MLLSEIPDVIPLLAVLNYSLKSMQHNKSTHAYNISRKEKISREVNKRKQITLYRGSKLGSDLLVSAFASAATNKLQ